MSINPNDLTPGPPEGPPGSRESIARKAERQMNTLAKWRAHLAGWQLGTRPKGDPESDAVRDHREATLLLRAEVSALAGLLMEKGIFTAEEFTARVGDEAEYLSDMMAKRWPGVRATETGLSYDAAKLPQPGEGWMKGWKP